MGMAGRRGGKNEELLATLSWGDSGTDGCWNVKDMFSACSFLVCSFVLLSGGIPEYLWYSRCEELDPDKEHTFTFDLGNVPTACIGDIRVLQNYHADEH